MEKDEIENWAKIKAALEAAGKTDCMYYRRACSILSGQQDPLPETLPDKTREPE